VKILGQNIRPHHKGCLGFRDQQGLKALNGGRSDRIVSLLSYCFSSLPNIYTITVNIIEKAALLNRVSFLLSILVCFPLLLISEARLLIKERE
jgi:hypothetical protein